MVWPLISTRKATPSSVEGKARRRKSGYSSVSPPERTTASFSAGVPAPESGVAEADAVSDAAVDEEADTAVAASGGAADPADVTDEEKGRRLSEIIALQSELSTASNARDEGKEFEVLVEGASKRSDKQLCGRTSQNKMVVFDCGTHKAGDYVRVRIKGSSSATLFGEEIL